MTMMRVEFYDRTGKLITKYEFDPAKPFSVAPQVPGKIGGIEIASVRIVPDEDRQKSK